jgi:hypothetical protein
MPLPQLVDDSPDTPFQILLCPTTSQRILFKVIIIEFAFENSFASLSHIVAMIIPLSVHCFMVITRIFQGVHMYTKTSQVNIYYLM